MNSNIIEKANKIVQSCDAAYLGVLDENGSPNVSTVSAINPENIFEAYFSTGLTENKAKRIRADKRASVCYRLDGDNVTLVGEAEILTDQEIKSRLWQDWFINHFPGGATDPNYCIIKFTAKRASLWVDNEVAAFTLGGLKSLPMSYEVKEYEIAPVKVMSAREVVPFAEIGSAMGRMFERLMGRLMKEGAALAGAPFCLYHMESANETQADIEVCEAVAELLPDDADVKGRTVPGAKGTTLRHIYKGSYEGLYAVYDDMQRWVDENGWTWDMNAPMREIYLNDPDCVPPEELLTEIICPVKKK